MENNQQQTLVVVDSKKSLGLAFVLTFLFGPLGMFYSTVAGALIMIIIAPIVGILTLGIGLIFVWPIAIIWGMLAAKAHNDKIKPTTIDTPTRNASTPQPTVIKEEVIHRPKPQSTQPDRTKLAFYDDANKLSDSKIEELLSDADELREEYVEALRFVLAERTTKRAQDSSRKTALSKALLIDAEERKARIASPSLYSDLSITALKYIERSIECSIEPSDEGFLATFEEGYEAPETPTERENRERWAQVQEELKQKRKDEARAKREAEEKAEANSRRNSYIMLLIIVVVGASIGLYTEVIKPNSEYKKLITAIDTRYENFDSSATAVAKKNELTSLMRMYTELSIPSTKKVERAEYIQNRVATIKSQIIILNKEIEIAEAEKARLEEEARVKAQKEAKAKAIAAQKKADAETRAVVAAAEKLPKKVFDEAQYRKAGSPQNLVIPHSFTSIGREACGYGWDNKLVSVTIPNSVTVLEEMAFSGCRFTSIALPNSVTTIGEMAFANCNKLTSITMHNSVKTIGKNAFAGCRSLTKFTIPNSVVSIGERAFDGCSGLTSITIPNSVKEIGSIAFMNCSKLTKIVIPNSVTVIRDNTFNSCTGLTSITIPNSVKTIGAYAFKGCSKLASITIPNSVTLICDGAFADCPKITSLTIPNSVTTVGKDLFKDTLYRSRGKVTIYISKSSPIYNDIKSRYEYNADIIIKTI